MTYLVNLIDMIQNIIDILFRPDSFFAKRIASEENLKIPFLFVAITGIIGAIYGYLVGSMTGRMFAGAGAGMTQVISITSLIGAFIGVMLFWLIGSGFFYLISMAFKGTGTFNRTLEFIGYGFIPQIFGSLITLAAAWSCPDGPGTGHQVPDRPGAYPECGDPPDDRPGNGGTDKDFGSYWRDFRPVECPHMDSWHQVCKESLFP